MHWILTPCSGYHDGSARTIRTPAIQVDVMSRTTEWSEPHHFTPGYARCATAHGDGTGTMQVAGVSTSEGCGYYQSHCMVPGHLHEQCYTRVSKGSADPSHPGCR